MTTTKQDTQPTTADLHQEYLAAADLLEELHAEQRQTPDLLADAADGGDSQRIKDAAITNTTLPHRERAAAVVSSGCIST